MRYDRSTYAICGTLLVIILFVSSCTCSNSRDKPESEKGTIINITLYDSDFSRAAARIYQLNNNSIKITSKSGIIGEHDSTFYKRALSDNEKQKVAAFFEYFPLDSLNTSYTHPNIDDGDQKVFIIRIGNEEKKIIVSNYYQPDIKNLIDLINGLLSAEFKLRYNAER